MFEWVKSKAKKNLLKHGIAFADAFAVFEDPNAVTLEDHWADKQRYVTIGMDALAAYWWWPTHGEAIYSHYFST